jgi:membrane fusion protein
VTAHDPLFRSEVIEARRQRIEGEVILTQPLRATTLTFLLFGIIAAAGCWIALGSYTRSEVARGILVTDRPSAKVMGVRPGQITELLVRDGDRVRAGQRLATVLVERPDEHGASASGESLQAFDAQRLLAKQQTVLAGERAAAERARLSATVNGLRRQRFDIASQIELQRQVVGSAQKTFDSMTAVIAKGFVSRIEYENRRQALLGARQRLSELRQQVSSIEAQERQAHAEIARIKVDAATEIANAQTAAEGYAQQRAEALAERAYMISAPISGRVTALQAEIGRTVDATTPLMLIVPERSRLHADVYAPTRAVGFVKPGQEVRLLYDAFPYQRFGSFAGRVTRVSRTILDPREVAAPLKIEEPVYRIEVALERQQVDAFGSVQPLQPGMTLSANLILDRRSFLDWLLEPLNAVLRRNK